MCGETVFLLFWLHIDNQSFKIVRKFDHPLVMQTLKLLVTLPPFYHLSIIITDQNMSFYGQVLRVTGEISI